jgi:hypothetical protein
VICKEFTQQKRRKTMNSETTRVRRIPSSSPGGMFWGISAVRFTFIVLLFALGTVAWAQDNATVSGSVLDPSGAAIANVAISITNTATGQVRETVSNSAGDYRFPNVGAGTYNLSASITGFQKYSKTGLVVHVADTLEANINLAIGSTQESVTVQADALALQSETSEVSSLISGQQVTQIATNGRNVTSLASLGMGKSNNLPSYSGAVALTSANGISFNGTRNTHNIWLLDGGELNDRGCGGCFSSLPSVDALAEFRTLDSNYGPDYGIGSGGTIAMVLKSGTKAFHGSLWEFNRNEAYQANNFFLKNAPTGAKPRPEFRLNVFGGNIGGPLGRKTFFFFNEEARRQIQASTPSPLNTIPASNFPTLGQDLNYVIQTSTTTTPNPVPIVPHTTDPAKMALYAQDGLIDSAPFFQPGTNQPCVAPAQNVAPGPANTCFIPANLIDQNVVRMLNAGTFPQPNSGNQFLLAVPQPTNLREEVLRIDHNINSKYQLMGHYLHDAVSQGIYPPLWGAGNAYPTVGTAMQNPSWSSTIKLTQTFSPTLLNESSFLFSGNTIHLSPITGPGETTFSQPDGYTATSLFPLANNRQARLPGIIINGAPAAGITWNPSYYPWKNSYFGYEPRDDMSWTHGRHQFKFGFSWLHAVKNQELQANTNGTFTFSNNGFSKDSIVNYLLGDADSFTQLDFLAGKHWVNNNYAFYGNDNWRVSNKLTLNLGMRYEVLPHAFERYDQWSNFLPSSYVTPTTNPVLDNGTIDPLQLSTFNGKQFYLNGIEQAGVNGFPRGNVKNYYHTVEPRVGFAYALGNDNKTVIRGGAGIFYERVQGNDVYNAAVTPPFAFQPTVNNVYFSDPTINANDGSQPAFPVFPASIQAALDYNYKPGGTGMFSLGVQRQVTQSVIAQVQYVGTRGWNQSTDIPINTLPATADDPAAPGKPYYDRQGVAGQLPDTVNDPTGALGKKLAKFNANKYRIFPGFAGITQEAANTNFQYDSLQMGIRVENRHGLTMQAAYTWSHEIDAVSNDLNAVDNPFDLGYMRGSGALDRRHIFNVNYVYNLPFFAHSTNKVAHGVLGGWQFSGVTVFQAGVPLKVTYSGSDTLGLGGNVTNRPDVVGPIKYLKKPTQWFDPTSFAPPVAPWDGGPNNGFGNARKDTIVGPGLLNFNMALFKSINLTERMKFELRFESFNTFNHVQFLNLGTTQNDPAHFGIPTSTYDPRTLQLGGKFSF